MACKIPKFVKLIGIGSILTILLIEITLRMLPVTTYLNYQNVSQPDPILKTTAPFIQHSLDWKFHQSTIRKVNNYGFPDDVDYQANTHPLAIIGDSYIQSLMLPYSDTLEGQIGKLLEPKKAPVYSFGVPGYSLAGYIGSAEYASKTFQPRLFIFLLTSGDITDSLGTKSGGTYFLSPKLELEFKPTAPSKIGSLLFKSALFRYLTFHLQFSLAAISPKPVSQNPINSPTIEQLSTRLLDYLEQKSTVRSTNTIFIIDCDRDKIYHHQLQTDHQLPLFAQVAKNRGYQIVDTLPIFTSQYQQSHRRVDFTPIDPHWNAMAHQLVAKAVYPVIKAKLVAK